jgi:hypothetical protein
MTTNAACRFKQSKKPRLIVVKVSPRRTLVETTTHTACRFKQSKKPRLIVVKVSPRKALCSKRQHTLLVVSSGARNLAWLW